MKKGIENTPILVALVANNKWYLEENYSIDDYMCKKCLARKNKLKEEKSIRK